MHERNGWYPLKKTSLTKIQQKENENQRDWGQGGDRRSRPQRAKKGRGGEEEIRSREYTKKKRRDPNKMHQREGDIKRGQDLLKTAKIAIEKGKKRQVSRSKKGVGRTGKKEKAAESEERDAIKGPHKVTTPRDRKKKKKKVRRNDC